MSTESETDDRAPGMVECEVCEIDVPAGEFCGLCGWHLTEHSRDGPALAADAFVQRGPRASTC